jgi:hypothetical protein
MITGSASVAGYKGTVSSILGGTFDNISTILGNAGSTLMLPPNLMIQSNLMVGGTLDTTITGIVSGTGHVINTGHTLFGTGTITAPLDINAGALHPGTASGPGTLTATNVTFAAGGVYQPDLSGTGSSVLDATMGTVTLGGNAVLSPDLVANFQPMMNQSFVVLKATTLMGTFQGLPDGAPVIASGQAFKVNYVTSSGPVGPHGEPPTSLAQVVLTRTTYVTRSVVQIVPNQPAFGQPVTVTISVSWPIPPANANGTTPSGNVKIREDGSVVAIMVLISGSAMMTSSDLTPGPHSFGADYTDTLLVANSQPSSALPTMVTVGPPAHSADLAFGGAGGHVRVEQFDQQVVADFTPFGAAYTGPVTVALGDIRHIGVKDLVVAAAVGNPNVKIYDGAAFAKGTFDPATPDASALASFFPYAQQFNVGATVAVGDIENNGFLDIVTGADVGNPDVRVYRGKDLATGTFNPTGASLIAQWFAYGLNFNVGANVAVGDVNKDGFADVVTGATAGNPHVKVYSGKAIATGTFSNANPDASLLAQVFPYALQFNVGAYVAVGDILGDGYGDLITGSSVGNPDVRVYSGKAIANGTFDPNASQLDQFYAYALNQNIGATVAAADVEKTGKADLVVGSTADPRFRVFQGNAQGVEPPTVLSGDLSNIQGFGGGGLFVGA